MGSMLDNLIRSFGRAERQREVAGWRARDERRRREKRDAELLELRRREVAALERIAEET